ncbi:polymeric immunoglobulin receptor-like isoform 2-T2 [Anomaloglossus baeobatrachus]
MELSVKLSIFSLLGFLLHIASQQNPTGKSPQILKAGPGKSVTIKCPMEPDTSQFTLLWTFGYERENIAQHQRYKNRMDLNVEMTINHLTEEDAGTYFCHLKSGSKVVETGVVLEVTPTPDLTGDLCNATCISPQIQKAEAGESVTIKCPIIPDTSRFSLVWTFGYERENLSHHQRYKNRTKLGELNMEITISNLTKEDSGIYFCQCESISKATESGVVLEVIATPDHAGNYCQENKLKEEVEPQDLCYTEISTNRINQQPRTKRTEETITYTAIKHRE